VGWALSAEARGRNFLLKSNASTFPVFTNGSGFEDIGWRRTGFQKVGFQEGFEEGFVTVNEAVE